MNELKSKIANTYYGNCARVLWRYKALATILGGVRQNKILDLFASGLSLSKIKVAMNLYKYVRVH